MPGMGGMGGPPGMGDAMAGMGAMGGPMGGMGGGPMGAAMGERMGGPDSGEADDGAPGGSRRAPDAGRP